MDALDHLGNVLYMLSDLHADDQCPAYVKALQFYNAERPNARVLPNDGYSTRIVHETPLSRALTEAGCQCGDCPPAGYPTDKTRCDECPKRRLPLKPAAQ